jgi:hypothetical protein
MAYRHGQGPTKHPNFPARLRVLVSLAVFRKIAQIDVGPQYIVIINHPGHYMKTSEMELPEHLYTRITSACGTTSKFIIAPDKLVSWAEEGRGDAIIGLCHAAYERQLASIDAWERDRIQQLEDELMTAGNGEDMYSRKYVNVKRYPTTPEGVVKEAEQKRANTRERMTEHQVALEKLVQEARLFISVHYATLEEDNTLAYLLTIGAIGAMAYVLLY